VGLTTLSAITRTNRSEERLQ